MAQRLTPDEADLLRLIGEDYRRFQQRTGSNKFPEGEIWTLAYETGLQDVLPMLIARGVVVFDAKGHLSSSPYPSSAEAVEEAVSDHL